MAKSNGFFSLRRGSTKSLTFSVLNGRQITKDRVSSVRNPRRQRQQYQRAIMATVMAAYSRMREIEDHAFEDASGKAENQQRFLSLNARRLRTLISEYVDAKRSPIVGTVAPKYPTIIPNSYVISTGSLKQQKLFTFKAPSQNNPGWLNIDEAVILPYVGAAGTSMSLNILPIMDALGLQPGSQITFCMINFDGGGALYPGNGFVGSGYGNFSFSYARLVFSKEFSRVDIDFASADEPRARAAQVVRSIFENYVSDETTPSLLSATEDENIISVSGQNWGVDPEDLLGGAGYDSSTTFALGIIHSVVDSKLRSNSEMTLNVTDVPDSYGILPEYILEAWQNIGVKLGDSDKYLEGGND